MIVLYFDILSSYVHMYYAQNHADIHNWLNLALVLCIMGHPVANWKVDKSRLDHGSEPSKVGCANTVTELFIQHSGYFSVTSYGLFCHHRLVSFCALSSKVSAQGWLASD